MVAPTCFGITLPSSGSVPSAFWEMLNWAAVDRILWMGVLRLVTWWEVKIMTFVLRSFSCSHTASNIARKTKQVWFDSQEGWETFIFSKTSIGALKLTKPPTHVVPGNFMQDKAAGAWKDITQLHLVSRWWMCSFINPFNYVCAFEVCARTAWRWSLEFMSKWLCSPGRAMTSCGSAAQRGLWPPVALQPSAGYDLRVSWGYLITNNDSPQSVGLLWTSYQFLAKTSAWQHTQQTNIHAPGGVRTHDRSRRAAVDLRLRPRGH
jgi:hypothetical protein